MAPHPNDWQMLTMSHGYLSGGGSQTSVLGLARLDPCPAILVYYSPAFVQKNVTMDCEGLLMVLAEVPQASS